MSLFILDSDHLSLYQRGHKPIQQYLLNTPPEDIAITIISVEELIRGRFAQVRKAKKQRERLNAYHWLSETFDFLTDFTVLKYDLRAEIHFQDLRAQKIRVGTQDLRIAAIALSKNGIVVTRNERDFGKIPRLKIEDWS